jgi:hypothetical protein
MPLFSADYFFDPPNSIDYAMHYLTKMSEDPSTTNSDILEIYDSIKWTHEEA